MKQLNSLNARRQFFRGPPGARRMRGLSPVMEEELMAAHGFPYFGKCDKNL